MKTFSEIYESVKTKFFKKSQLQVESGTVIDSYMLASSQALYEAYQEIENNKNPYLYTNLSGDDLDSMGYLLNCARLANETDASYKYRLLKWTLNNESCNITAINNALIGMTYASSATYTPYTDGVGTATVYVIPTSYDATTEANAINEVETRLSTVVSPASHVTYTVPTAKSIKLVCYIGISSSGDLSLIEKTITASVKEYVNNIAIGGLLELGEINKIGVNTDNVNYFNAVQLYIDGDETSALNVLQRIDSKFIFDSIVWWTAG